MRTTRTLVTVSLLTLGLLAGCNGTEPDAGAGGGDAPGTQDGTEDGTQDGTEDGTGDGAGTGGEAGVVEVAVTSESAEIEWIGTKDDGKHDGGFREVTGTVRLDPSDLTTIRFTLEIDTTSLWSDDDKLTDHLKSPDFFEVNTYPTATFTTTSVTADGTDGKYTVTGDLDLHGVTKSISFPATITWIEPTLTVSTQFAIDRQDFGISYGTGKIHDEVTILATFAGSR